MSPPDPIQAGRDAWIAHVNGPVEPISTATALVRGSQVIQALSAEVLGPNTVTSAQIELLVTLDGLPGPTSMGGLAVELGLHPTTVSRTVSRLATSGYTARTQDPTDGRVAVVEITPAGRRVVEESLRALTRISFGLSGWNLAEAREFVELVRPLLQPLEHTPPEPSRG